MLVCSWKIRKSHFQSAFHSLHVYFILYNSPSWSVSGYSPSKSQTSLKDPQGNSRNGNTGRVSDECTVTQYNTSTIHFVFFLSIRMAVLVTFLLDPCPSWSAVYSLLSALLCFSVRYSPATWRQNYREWASKSRSVTLWILSACWRPLWYNHACFAV